jgi:hypothetical protein
VEVVDEPVRAADNPLADPERVWRDFAADAATAYPIALGLVKDPARSLAFLRQRLKPVPRDRQRTRKLIAQLDDEEFTVREAATRELTRLASTAEPELRAAAMGVLSVEARHRVETVLAQFDQVAVLPDQLRAVRAILTLERLGTPEARAVLATLAADGETLPGREAKAALKRLGP